MDVPVLAPTHEHSGATLVEEPEKEQRARMIRATGR
jgi:hypothetical protein